MTIKYPEVCHTTEFSLLPCPACGVVRGGSKFEECKKDYTRKSLRHLLCDMRAYWEKKEGDKSWVISDWGKKMLNKKSLWGDVP